MIKILFLAWFLFVLFFLWLWHEMKGAGGVDFGPDDEKKDQMMLAVFSLLVLARIIFKELREKVKERFSW